MPVGTVISGFFSVPLGPSPCHFCDLKGGFRRDEHANSDGGRMSEPHRGEFAQEPERIGACEE